MKIVKRKFSISRSWTNTEWLISTAREWSFTNVFKSPGDLLQVLCLMVMDTTQLNKTIEKHLFAYLIFCFLSFSHSPWPHLNHNFLLNILCVIKYNLEKKSRIPFFNYNELQISQKLSVVHLLNTSLLFLSPIIQWVAISHGFNLDDSPCICFFLSLSACCNIAVPPASTCIAAWLTLAMASYLLCVSVCIRFTAPSSLLLKHRFGHIISTPKSSLGSLLSIKLWRHTKTVHMSFDISCQWT